MSENTKNRLRPSVGRQNGAKSGSLRDFRVDSLGSPDANRANFTQTPRPPVPNPTNQQASVNRASIKPASFDSVQSLSEWDREETSNLWKSWEEDLDIIEKKTHSSANMRAEIQAETQPPSEVNEAPKALVPWAADLALTERRMERRGEVEYSSSFQKQEMLKQQTTEFLRVLRTEFSRSIEEFNDARQSGGHAIHLYSISNTENDFMLFRNGSKLVVSGQRSGRILFAFNQFLGQVYNPQLGPNFELEARWGPFDRLFWSYQGERVQVNDIIRFFVSEFVRQSYK